MHSFDFQKMDEEDKVIFQNASRMFLRDAGRKEVIDYLASEGIIGDEANEMATKAFRSVKRKLQAQKIELYGEDIYKEKPSRAQRKLQWKNFLGICKYIFGFSLIAIILYLFPHSKWVPFSIILTIVIIVAASHAYDAPKGKDWLSFSFGLLLIFISFLETMFIPKTRFLTFLAGVYLAIKEIFRMIKSRITNRN